MSADMWIDCPKCKLEKTVRIDGIYDIEVTGDGRIDITNIKAKCYQCKLEFK